MRASALQALERVPDDAAPFFIAMSLGGPSTSVVIRLFPLEEPCCSAVALVLSRRPDI